MNYQNLMHCYIQDAKKGDFRKKQSEISKVKITEIVMNFFNVSYNEMCEKNRRRHIVLARQILMHALAKHTKMSLHEIGKYLGGFDHTTIIHSRNTVDNLRSTNTDYANDLLIIENRIKHM